VEIDVWLGQKLRFDLGLPLPLYPDQRTSSHRSGWSGSCHWATSQARPDMEEAAN
jgi:hypothetical protein